MRLVRSARPALLAAALLLPAAAATAADPFAGSASLVEGSCATPGAAVATLAVVPPGSPQGATTALPVTAFSGSAVLRLTSIVGAPHAVVLRGGATDADPIVACGDVGGMLTEATDLAFGVAPVAGSGTAGVARLQDVGDGTTAVTLEVFAAGGSGEAPGSPAPSAGVPAVESVSLAGNLYFSGWSIAITDATYDPVAATLAINGTYENHADIPTHLLVIQQDGGVRLDWNGTVVEVAFKDPVAVPAHGTVNATLQAIYAIPEGFSLADAVLTYGQPTDQQAILPLTEGATGTALLPRPFPISGKAAVKGHAVVRFQGGQVIGADCGGRPDEIYFTTADADRASILLDVRIGASKIGTQLSSYVTTPDGITSPGTPGATTVSPRQTLDGQLCYTVPTPVQGAYVLTLEDADGKRTKVTLDVP